MNLLARLVTGAATLGLAILSTHLLDTHGRGVYAILGTWAGIVSTVITGSTPALAADLIHGRHGLNTLHAVVSAIVLGSALVLLPLTVLVALITHAATLAALGFTAVLILLLAYSTFEKALAQARGDVLRVSLTDIGMAACPLLATVAVATTFDATATSLIGAWAVGALVTAGIQFAEAVPGAVLVGARVWRAAARVVRRSLGVAFANGIAILGGRIDVLVVAAVISASAAGVYSISVALAANLMLVSRSLLTATYHSIMTSPAGEVVDRLSQALRHSLILVLFAGGASVPVVALTAGFVFGDAYSDVWEAYALLVPATACICVVEFLRHFLLTRLERQREFVVIATAMLVLNGVLAVAGSAAFGIMGAAASTTVAYAAGAFVLVALCASNLSTTMRRLVMPRRSDIGAYWRVGRSLPGRLRGRRSA